NQGANRERDIRKYFVDRDLIESVILLPENLFYNTSAPGIVMVLNRAKKHSGEVLLFNASQLFVKGRPKNELRDEHIAEVADLYARWKSIDQRCEVVNTLEIVGNDYNLSPSRYVAGAAAADGIPLED